jgi:ferric iron reductase protein FhuF
MSRNNVMFICSTPCIHLEVSYLTYFMLAALIHPFFVMLIDREKILQTTLSQIMAESDEGLTKPLRVIFMNEEAIDEGGVRKELFQLLVSQLFSLEFGK